MLGLLALINADTAQAVFALTVLGTYGAYVRHLHSVNLSDYPHFRTTCVGN